jgi:predicted  nucleic acid-binding Zn-ribbon protein
MEELVSKLREIQVGLKRSLFDLQQKLDAFDSEPELLTNLENAKRDAEARASSLEDEVKKLREELKDIRGFLGFNDDKR